MKETEKLLEMEKIWKEAQNKMEWFSTMKIDTELKKKLKKIPWKEGDDELKIDKN